MKEGERGGGEKKESTYFYDTMAVGDRGGEREKSPLCLHHHPAGSEIASTILRKKHVWKEQSRSKHVEVGGGGGRGG